MSSFKNKRAISALALVIAMCLVLPALSACSAKVEEEKMATFSGQTKMFAEEGIGIVMDSAFTKYYPDNCALACENGDLKFEAFYLEKYYFTENGRDIHTAKGALEYTNPGKDSGAVVETNSYMQPFVEFVTPDTKGTDNNIKMYYFCVEDDEGYWFCTFFSYEKNYDEYKPVFYGYIKSLTMMEE